MCGIVAYLGIQESAPIVIKGMKRLEYRGYDSSGIAIINPEQGLKVYKKKGKVVDLENVLKDNPITSNIAIGHTRWATHGEPNDTNAHPHTSNSGRLTIVHNGIIENYSALKQRLIQKGYTFKSQTDSEVLVNFIEEILLSDNLSLEEAVRVSLNEVVGAYAIVLLDTENPNQLIGARKGSPLVIGVGKGEFFFASDASPIIEYTKDVVYLDDLEIGIVSEDGLIVKNLKNESFDPKIQRIELELEAIEKGGFEHFMLKEIYEQPKSLSDCLRGRVKVEEGLVVLGGLRDYIETLAKAPRIIIVACGTSWHAGLVGEYLFEELARINVEVEYASEFRYRNPIINPGDIVIAVSQSGETADTLAALEMAKSRGAVILGVCNVVGSSISRITDAGVFTHAGPEIGVASTKAFTTQVAVLTMIVLATAHKKGTLSENKFKSILEELTLIPSKIQEILKLSDKIKDISKLFTFAQNFIFLGRGFNFPVALEGALKLKEISYIHAEGYPAAEMKHGPIALIDEDMPVVFIASKDNSYDKVVSNIQEVKARKGRVIAVVTQGDEEVRKMVDFVIEIPETTDILQPLLTVVPLQLLSYYIAVLRGRNVDQPRNLAKSVTVE